MPRIAILGANGQVGAELCLLLARQQDMEIVPVCRNATGSAFLRYSGIACRHGRAADATEAPQLLGDCDFIVNCALGSGTPRQIAEFDRKLITNMFQYSKHTATIIHFSTLMVYGDPSANRLIRWRNPYGRAKLAAERRVRKESARSRKSAFILRLGHVCGRLQNITQKIQTEIALGRVVLPAHDLPSNAVYTSTIVDAIRSIVAGREQPGAFDLINVPQWTWRQVYEFESLTCEIAFAPRIMTDPHPESLMRRVTSWLRGTLTGLAKSPIVKRTLDFILALASPSLNARTQATWYKLRARAEINALMATSTPAEELSWIRLDRHGLRSLRPTIELLKNGHYKFPATMEPDRWPKDLELFTEVLGPQHHHRQGESV